MRHLGTYGRGPIIPPLVAVNAAPDAPRVPTVRRLSVLRRDPSRTTMLRRRFIRDLSKIFAQLKRDIRELVVAEDAFGLTEQNDGGLKALLTLAEAKRWQFLRSDQKVTAFRNWLNQQIDDKVLRLDPTGSAWTRQYVFSSYRQGLLNAYMATRRNAASLEAGFVEGSQAEFLRSSFNSSVAIEKIELLGTRVYEGLRGVSSQMSAQMSRVLAQGIADGKHPYQLAKELNAEIGFAFARAARIARTEIMHAHAEGQLDGYEALGVQELGVMAEWSTAGDDRVCPLCVPLEGGIFTIAEARGMIPRHPNCRCTWIPANVGEKGKGQKRGKGVISDAVKQSLRAESPSAKTDAQARKSSRWVGADRSFSGKKPQPPI